MLRQVARKAPARPEQVTRSLQYSSLQDKDISFFETILGKKHTVTDEEELSVANTDWTKKFKGTSALMLKPKTTEEVSAVLKYCNSRKLAVVPQGGRTGLVGGSVPVYDEVIVNTARMNRIIGFDESYGILQAEAGCILSDLQEFAKGKGYEVPLDLGAKGSCFIGGNLATNAGGIKFIRHNSMHANTVGLKAVLADGTVLDNMTTLRKDNTGTDLKHLFIGSEGTLGLITECSLLCPVQPKTRYVAVVACSTFEDVLAVLQGAKRELPDVLQAIEYLDLASMDVVRKMNPDTVYPFEKDFPHYVLVEIAQTHQFEGSESSDFADLEMDRLLAFLERVEDCIQDGVVNQDEKQLHQLWHLREGISNSTVQYGYTLKYDISLPSTHYYQIVEDVRQLIRDSGEFSIAEKAEILPNGHGHVGDGNLHLNVVLPGYEDTSLQQRTKAVIEPFVMNYVRGVQGSISAEHGIGQQKPTFLHFSKSLPMIRTMQTLKRALDPNLILNPYKMLPTQDKL